MNREIKFRGYFNNGWAYGTYHYSGDNKHHYILKREMFLKIPVLPSTEQFRQTLHKEEVCEVDVKSVGQFTGLKDKNGKEIYEGDILKMNEQILSVIFNSCTACFDGEYPETKEVDALYYFNLENTEIIGNIYENPDLMIPTR